VLSDCPADKEAVIRDKFNLTLFEFVIFSSDGGMSKDDDNFFSQISRKLKLMPAEMLYSKWRSADEINEN
jgi:hypothetical protein